MAILPSTLRSSTLGQDPSGLRFVSVETTALGGRGQACFFVPDAERPLPLVILLHGAYGSCWDWATRGGVHVAAARAMGRGALPPMVLAMPGDGGAGASTGYFRQEHADFEAWVMDELESLCAFICPQVRGTERFIAGYSMGGFGALRLAAKYEGHWNAVAAHSSVTALSDLPPFLDAASCAPMPLDPRDADVWPWLEAAGPRLPPLRFDCGRDDPLLAANRALSDKLRVTRIPHTFEVHPGGHDFDYWSERIPDTLSFFATHTKGPSR
ncbi:MAG: alpha/beta fold hydrolase [Myxococcales bacterium]|nr:alpha/beta fold hydrolase [Myxococcales bacterium]